MTSCIFKDFRLAQILIIYLKGKRAYDQSLLETKQILERGKEGFGHKSSGNDKDNCQKFGDIARGEKTKGLTIFFGQRSCFYKSQCPLVDR